MSEPIVTNVVNESGEVSDEIDYALSKFLLAERGAGFTACQPKLVELEDGTQAIKMGIDHTYLGTDMNIYGFGIVGQIYVSTKDFSIVYCTPIEELEENIKVLKDSGIDPQIRPKGKY